jgi:mannose-1-phosphate guanylyltransferase/mannose-1-phosphate guanylyltransferase/phosphomannomutase
MPLTTSRPKPLLPVANRPVMAQGLQTLRHIGITAACVNVSYHGGQIMEAFGDGRAHGMRLHWSQEEEPTGTAGGMKRMQSLLGDDQVVIIAGDAMLDLDLVPLLAAHRACGAFATLATVTVSDPSEYGVVVTDAEHRIMHFQEKPAPGTEISHQANTGIYIFEPGIFDLIPAGEFCDFALNVFPEILRRQLPFFAFPLEGYWTDIGNPADYLQANLDYLAGGIRVEGRGQRVNGNLIARDVSVAGAKLVQCVIGDDVVLPRGTDLTRCVVWPGTVLPEACCMTSAVLTPEGSYQVEGKTARVIDIPITV